MTGEKYKGYKELDRQSFFLDPLLPYGEDPGDDCYNLPVERKGNEVRYSNDDGAIVDRNLGSTNHTQTTGNPIPNNA